VFSVKEIRNLAQSLGEEAFRAQLGPFALVQRPSAPSPWVTPQMGVPLVPQKTVAVRPEEISRGIVSLLMEEFDGLQVSTLPPLRQVDELVAGRLPDCDLFIDHPSVSKRHALLKWDNEKGLCTVKDLGSTNGTFLNEGALGDTEAALRDGDILSFGDVQFWFLSAHTLWAKLMEGSMQKGSRWG
jgi:hypothetical protein